MRIHCVEHVPFEGPAAIATWARLRHHELSTTGMYRAELLPAVDDFDLLVVMGGPMSVHNEREFPWLKAEKQFIERAVGAGTKVLGICLGAQLLAQVLGGRVYRGREKEIGWFPVRTRPEAKDSRLAAHLPETFEAFHWHGEMFDLPTGAICLAETDVCPNQAFEYEGRTLGLQFHLEVTRESVRQLAHHCARDLTGGTFVQTGNTLLGSEVQFHGTQALLYETLDRLSQ